LADNVDVRLLGEQVAQLQAQVRGVKADVAQLRAEQLQMEADQAQLKIDLFHRIDNFEAAVDAKFAQVQETAATNLEVVLAAIQAAGKA
jgi:regulator of replication initiation timing